MGMSTTLLDYDFASMAPLVPWSTWNLTLKNTKEFVCAIRVFAPLTPILACLKMINALLVLHPLDIKLPLFEIPY
jgi:hypothetical protein